MNEVYLAVRDKRAMSWWQHQKSKGLHWRPSICEGLAFVAAAVALEECLAVSASLALVLPATFAAF